MSEQQQDTPEVSVPADLSQVTESASGAPDGTLADNTPVAEPSEPVEPAGGEESASTSSSDQSEWDELLTGIENADNPIDETPVSTPVSPTPAEETDQEVPEPEAPATPQAEPPAPVPQEPVAQTPEAPTPEAPAATPEQLAEQNRQLVERFEQSLEPGYQIQSEEDVRELQVNPEKILPKLASRIHSRIYTQVLQTVGQMFQQQLPGMVQNIVQTTNESQTATDAFYSDWPELTAHSEAVQAASAFMQGDPNSQRLDRAAYMDKLGKMAWMHAGLDPNALVVKLADKENAQAATTPGVTTEVVTPINTNFTPAHSGGGGKVPRTPAEPTNEFELLSIAVDKGEF